MQVVEVNGLRTQRAAGRSSCGTTVRQLKVRNDCDWRSCPAAQAAERLDPAGWPRKMILSDNVSEGEGGEFGQFATVVGTCCWYPGLRSQYIH